MPRRCVMLWEVEIQPIGRDLERERVCEEYDLLTHAGHGGTLTTSSGVVPLRPGAEVIARSSRGYLLQGDLDRAQVERLAAELLVDPLTETRQVCGTNREGILENGGPATVLLKPGVMDPVALSVIQAAQDLEVVVDSVHTFRRYYWGQGPCNREVMLHKVLCNEAIERILDGGISARDLGVVRAYAFERITLPLRDLDEATLLGLSRRRQLSLSLAEMRAIQAHFRDLGREPTDVELETLAQTWSEHCSHKTLRGK